MTALFHLSEPEILLQNVVPFALIASQVVVVHISCQSPDLGS